MKICKYCGASNDDDAKKCSSCGAKEFSHKCGNCGTIYDEGNFCLNCGVKAGAKPKICPNCGREYYSAACPDCGYMKNRNGETIQYVEVPVEPVKKRRTWLWVLGWIIMFPVPLTIIMVTHKDINFYVRVFSVIAAWLAFFYMASAGDAEAAVNSTKIVLGLIG